MKHLLVCSTVKMPKSNNEINQIHVDTKLTLLIDTIEEQLKSRKYDTLVLFPSIKNAIIEVMDMMNSGFNPTIAQEIALNNFKWCLETIKIICKTQKTRLILFPVPPNPLFLQNSEFYNFNQTKEETVKNTFVKVNLIIRDANLEDNIRTSKFFDILYRQKQQRNAPVKAIRTSFFNKSGSLNRKAHRNIANKLRKALNTYRTLHFIFRRSKK